MKVVYDNKDDMYIVTVECPETTTYIKANGYAEARSEFLDRMKFMFDEALCNSVAIDEAINHFKYGISHDIFSEKVARYAKLAIAALEKYKSN
jgi:hypothetical protein